MKQPKKPTYNNKKLMSKNGLDPAEWSVVADTRVALTIVNKKSGAIHVLNK